MTQNDPGNLARHRAAIDAIDDQMVKLVAARLRVIEKVVQIKQREGIPARLQDRVDQVIARTMQSAQVEGADPDLARTVWSAMIEWFIAYEERALRQRTRP